MVAWWIFVCAFFRNVVRIKPRNTVVGVPFTPGKFDHSRMAIEYFRPMYGRASIGAGPRSSSAGGGRPGNGGSLVDLLCIFSVQDRSVARCEGFGRRGVRRLGTPNLRHALALNWKCEMPRVCKRFVNASLAKGEPIGGMIASEHNESKTHERGAIYTWTKQPTGARGGPSIGLY